MHPIFRNVLAIIAGVIVGGVVNMGLISISGSIVPLPKGVDPSSVESIAENLHLYQAKHFIMPFLAHALGTLAGAFVAASIVVNNNRMFGVVIGVFFLVGGVMACLVIPAPTWFIVLDLIMAYIPMGYLGGKLASGKSD
ncbi:MAG: hypothetical protein ACI9XO_003353 [Paraglaciecola sp.]|jgi:hypothetical protein